MALVAVVDSIAVAQAAAVDTTVIAVVTAVVMAVVNTTDINQPRCNTIPFRIIGTGFFLPAIL
jgi:hypothetical protein